MLPFLKPKAVSGVIISHRKPLGGQTEEPTDDEGQEDAAMQAAAQDIITAIHNNDSTHLAHALRAAFQILDSEPHDEGEHTNEQGEE